MGIQFTNSTKIVGKPTFTAQFRKITKCYKKVLDNINIMRQSTCLVVNLIPVYGYNFLFNCLMMPHRKNLIQNFHWWVCDWILPLAGPPWLKFSFALTQTFH